MYTEYMSGKNVSVHKSSPNIRNRTCVLNPMLQFLQGYDVSVPTSITSLTRFQASLFIGMSTMRVVVAIRIQWQVYLLQHIGCVSFPTSWLCHHLNKTSTYNFFIMHQGRHCLSLLFIRTCVEFVLRWFALLISTQCDNPDSVFSPSTETVECRSCYTFVTLFCRMGAVVALQGNVETLPTTVRVVPPHGQRRWRASCIENESSRPRCCKKY